MPKIIKETSLGFIDVTSECSVSLNVLNKVLVYSMSILNSYEINIA